jgi:hypothetical protein
MLKLALLLLSSTAYAAAPPSPLSGCSIPPSTFVHSWVFDPLNGDDLRGAGTAAAPWKTLASLTTAGAWGSPRLNSYPFWNGSAWAPDPAGPVSPGDAILLGTGNHGNLDLGVYGQKIINSAWLTFMPVPGASPVVTHINIRFPINKVRFTGLKVRSSGVPGEVLAMSYDGASDLMFDNNDMASVEDAVSTAYTTIDQWEKNVTSGGVYLGAVNCATVANNKLHSIATGISLNGGTFSVAKDNEIAYFDRDAVDIGGDDLYLLRNFIHDTEVTSGNHGDCVQGYSNPSAKHKHIVIDGNRCYRKLDPNNKFATELQGIDAFNDDWTNVLVTRNVVVTSSCWAFSWGSTHYGLFAQNTAITDGELSGEGGAAHYCEPRIVPFTATHEFPAGDHVVAVNNTASMADFTGSAQSGNVVVPTTSRVFVNPPVDLQPAAGSPLIGAGVTSLPELTAIQKVYPNLVLPKVDINNNAFSPTKPTVGAYAYATAPICTMSCTTGGSK